MSALNIGQGLCRGTARLLIKPHRAVIELGAAEDVLTKALNAVHHANRHAPSDDFIAVALPEMHKGRTGALPGHEIELIGSQDSLGGLLALDGIAVLRRRGMLMDLQVEEVFFEAGMTGAAYVRNQSSVKETEGWIRRNKDRSVRRGSPLPEAGLKPRRRTPEVEFVALSYGDIRIRIQEVVGEFTGEPMSVSTYGFSRESSPAILPVYPESERLKYHAA